MGTCPETHVFASPPGFPSSFLVLFLLLLFFAFFFDLLSSFFFLLLVLFSLSPPLPSHFSCSSVPPFPDLVEEAEEGLPGGPSCVLAWGRQLARNLGKYRTANKGRLVEFSDLKENRRGDESNRRKT